MPMDAPAAAEAAGTHATKTTVVRHVDGSVLRIEHAADATLADIKSLIAERTGIDPALQRLSRGGEPVYDTPADSALGKCTRAELRRKDVAYEELWRQYGDQTCQQQATSAFQLGRVAPCRMPNPCGTACYANAALQCMLSVSQLTDIFRGSVVGALEQDIQEASPAGHRQCRVVCAMPSTVKPNQPTVTLPRGDAHRALRLVRWHERPRVQQAVVI
jgi:hypothetical protein